MSDLENPDKNSHVQPPPATAPLSTDEGESLPQGSGIGGVSAITRKWKRDDFLKRGCLILRGLALVLSLLAFIIMATNKHGDWKDFDKYEEYRYVLAIAILSTLYTGAQSLRHVYETSTGKQLFQRRTSLMVDFVGDQVVAYLLVSSASSAVPLTNRMREGQDNIFTDASAAAISMSFLAFFSLALSALISGHKLATQPYI